ncbi:MAG: phosphodiesterase [Clostridia bacterium]|nr:phosphodiesterase [Clostridia bacterium]
MKLMIASDIHGSAVWCRRMLEAWEREAPERLLLLGDLLYHGPRNDLPEGYSPKEVAAMLNGIADQLLCVRGNCEAEVDQMVLDFPVLAEYCVLYIGDRMICASHGHRLQEVTPDLPEGSLLLAGHTHIPDLRCEGRPLYANPGSVAIPKAGTPHSYMTLEDGVLRWMDLTKGLYREETLP